MHGCWKGLAGEPLLDVAQVGAHIEQMSRVAVAHAMGMDAIPDAGREAALLEDPARVTIAEPSRQVLPTRAQRDEQGLREDPRAPAGL